MAAVMEVVAAVALMQVLEAVVQVAILEMAEMAAREI
jgi:hypothetical protein